MSSASSNQSVVCDGANYEEVYLLGHKNQESPSEERSPSASSPSSSSPSSTNEDMEMANPKEGSDDGEEQPVKSAVGADGLREFIMLPKWSVNDFTSTIKEKHFNTLRANYQISNSIPIHLPYKSKKCYYERVEGVGVYKKMLKAGLRFPLSSLHHELLKYLGLSINQISPNAWKVFIATEVLYGAMSNGARRLTMQEFLHYYSPNEIDKSKGIYSFVPRSPLLKVIFETPDSNGE